MRASHVIACIVGTIACFALFVTSSITLNALGADAHDNRAGIWIYTPHVRPGDAMRAKVGLSFGDSCSIEEVTARVSGSAAPRSGGEVFRRASQTRGTSEVEVSIPIDVGLPP